ncbi:MAG: aminopeptidase 2 [Lasallia pustulata]|uniref:Aminopeptidase n=1 Tax=Lasallia pustulata TaxID=136370 RepID=A0A5M8PM95_9LECA|nr:MAG: aminopeptidase 2 [Lasallia pustulata]
MALMDRDVLPDAVKPVHYDISIYDLELGDAFSYQGAVTIELEIRKATKEIVLNAHQLKIHSAILSVGEKQALKASDISYDEKSQRVTLSFPEDLSSAPEAALQIIFSGIMNNTMAGFYRSRYKPAATPAASVAKDDEYHYMFSTQFESCDARRAFPCFDEPNLKATFDFKIEIPEDQVALSNMPVKKEDQSSNGLKTVEFERTPIMSTYLLVWAFGDFEYVEDFTKREYNGRQLPVRVYTTKGLKEQGRLGLQVAHQVVDYFSEIFQIDYPLPKVDLLAAHEFSHGAMEAWGLITYRTTAILFDEEQSDAKYKNRVAYVVAHELAHQWFGNLVTMDWWSELWLNEGFATWVGWLAVDHLYPEWNVWGQFVTESVQTALQLDSLRSSHPIEVPVTDALEIDQIFDHISYLKGSSVLRMLSGHLGREKFLSGVSNYLKAHAYGNATTNDLWKALSEASGKDVNSFMDIWIKKIGYPVLTVAEEPGQIGVRQSRFLLTGDAMPEEDETLWWIPLGLKTDPQASGAASNALTVKEETLRDVDESFYKLNSNQMGFYRTNYPPERLAKLSSAKDKLTVEDKVGLIGDAAALAVAGDATTAGLLAFTAGFKDEKNYLVWSQVINSLTNVRSIFSDNEATAKGLKNFTLQLVTVAAEKIGWDFAPDEDFLTGQLRSLLINTAGGAGHQGIIAEAKRRFKAYTSGDRTAIHPSLRSAVFRTVIAEGDRSEYEAVKHEYLNTNSVDGKEICLQSLGRVQSTDLVKEFLDFQFSDRVATQDAHTGAISLASNPKARYTLWQYIKENWDAVHKKLSGNSVVIDRFLKNSLLKFASHEVEKDITAFFKDKDTKGYDRGLIQVSDTVKGNANYKDRDEALILEWLKAHEYA